MTKTALVTGATGAIGAELVALLVQQGDQVRTYSRHLPEANLFPATVQHIQGDITDRQKLDEAMQGVNVVFHLAAKVHIVNPSPSLAHDYYRVNVEGTQHTAEAAACAGVRRFVYFSTVKVYGIHELTPVSEEVPPQPSSLYARSKWQGEAAAQEVTDLEVVVLRLSAVFGSRLRGSWGHLLGVIRRGWFIPIGNLENHRCLTFTEDVARAALLAAEHTDMIGGIYNVVGYEAVTMREILDAIYQAQGKRLPRVSLPAHPFLAGVSTLEKTFQLIRRRSPLSTEILRQFTEDEVYSGNALRQLGFSAQHSLIDAWRLAIKKT